MYFSFREPAFGTDEQRDAANRCAGQSPLERPRLLAEGRQFLKTMWHRRAESKTVGMANGTRTLMIACQVLAPNV